LNSVFAQYEELSRPQFAVINLSLRLRLITANFGLDKGPVIIYTRGVGAEEKLFLFKIFSYPTNLSPEN
jgi:hypothetical protein